jgi:2-dehydro-3-deoxyphosphogluconate aldolase/(4S)-4-hydroxy-2-oxoglutarate aldolase
MAPDGIVAVLRGGDPGRVERAARAVARAGVRFIEVTCTVPGAMGVIERLADLRDAALGMGTVLSVAQAEAALNAGARFLVSPACLPELVPTARAPGAACVLGGLSPTEVFRAWEAGADLVKVFPVGPLGGPAYLRELAGPYPHMRLMASGGIGLEDIPADRLPTVAAIALGGELAPIAAMAAGDWAAITRRAQQPVASWQART